MLFSTFTRAKYVLKWSTAVILGLAALSMLYLLSIEFRAGCVDQWGMSFLRNSNLSPIVEMLLVCHFSTVTFRETAQKSFIFLFLRYVNFQSTHDFWKLVNSIHIFWIFLELGLSPIPKAFFLGQLLCGTHFHLLVFLLPMTLISLSSRSIHIFLNPSIGHLTSLLLNVYCIFIIFLCLLLSFFNLLPRISCTALHQVTYKYKKEKEKKEQFQSFRQSGTIVLVWT